MRIHTRVCRTPFWTHVSDILVGTYSDLLEQWESIPPEIQKKILAIHMDRIDAINGRDRKAPAATRWDPETVIDDEGV
jgi:hypothetical protein